MKTRLKLDARFKRYQPTEYPLESSLGAAILCNTTHWLCIHYCWSCMEEERQWRVSRPPGFNKPLGGQATPAPCAGGASRGITASGSTPGFTLENGPTSALYAYMRPIEGPISTGISNKCTLHRAARKTTPAEAH